MSTPRSVAIICSFRRERIRLHRLVKENWPDARIPLYSNLLAPQIHWLEVDLLITDQVPGADQWFQKLAPFPVVYCRELQDAHPDQLLLLYTRRQREYRSRLEAILHQA